MTTPPVPSAGYSLESIHTIRASYGLVLAEGDPPEERELSFMWDWRVAEKPGSFQVLLGAQVGPCKDAPDELEAVILGTFEVIGEVQSVNLRGFVELNAPAVLMPYLRQALTTLSAQGPMGPFYLIPINVTVLSESFDRDNATGASQLKEDPSLIGSASD